MLVYQAHDILAKQLGDIINVSPFATGQTTVIPDGVVYLKIHRDDLLNRAMISIIEQAIKSVVGYPKKMARETIHRLFPHLTSTFTPGQASFTINNCIMLLQATYVGMDNLTYPLPIKDNLIEVQGLLNSRSVQTADPFCYSVGSTPNNLNITVFAGNANISNITMHCLRVPTFLTDTPLPVNTDVIDFEEYMMSSVLSLATMFGMADRQDLEIDRYMPFTLQNIKLGVPNANN